MCDMITDRDPIASAATIRSTHPGHDLDMASRHLAEHGWIKGWKPSVMGE